MFRRLCRGILLLSLSISNVVAQNVKEYRDVALNRDGDAARGKALFLNDSKGACSKCHSTDGSSSKAGPDLFAAGDKLPRRDLIESILQPSVNIAVGYGATIIEAKSGEQITGVIKQSTAAFVELLNADGKAIKISTTDIAQQRGSSISLMPEGLQTAFTRDEFVDLIQYLVSLKQPENSLTANRGNTSEIAELAHPVALKPFIGDELRFPHHFVQKPGEIRSGLVWFGQAPGDGNLFFAVHQTGKIWLIEKNPGEDRKELFADFAAELFNERGPNGLLSMAFHPRFRENGKYYLKHQVFEDGKIATTLVEKIAGPDRRGDSGKAARRLLKIIATTQDHTGGLIEFGPDGFLYLAMGDTGPQQDPQGHGQDMQTFLGKILRIDVDRVDATRPYAIPRDNPFIAMPGALPEIWACGFREPWRFSFDKVTGDLWVGDVGQDRVEEAAIVRRGENHGWNVFEGFEPFSNKFKKEGVTFIPPIFGYRRKFGNSITGGYVYRGDKKSSFYGAYICGDYTSHRIWALTQENRALKTVRQIATAPQNIASFAQDNAGELYVVGYEGMIYKMDFTTANFNETTLHSSAK